MAKCTFTKGFAKAKEADGKAPMVGKIVTKCTVIEFETSLTQDRAWPLYNFIAALADDNVQPQEAFEKAFGK